jgi:hypothetical protein
MKMILLFTCVITLITTTGCFFPGRGGRGWHDRGEVIVARPAFAVRAPEVIVAPTLVAVNTPEAMVR